MTRNGGKASARVAASRLWKIVHIKDYPHNARTHPPAQIKLLAELLKRFGPDQDIVVDEKGVILKGHGRKLAAIEAGLARFPVTQRVGLTENDKAAMRIADNQVALLAGWDSELVRFEITKLQRDEYPIELLGFGEAQLVSFMTTPQPPSAFGTFDETIETAHECPKCGYKWSGNSAPAPEPPPAQKKKKK
jgi:hypothetical protein